MVSREEKSQQTGSIRHESFARDAECDGKSEKLS
jgi:hypothetical protein